MNIIENEKELQITKDWIEKFEKSLEEINALPDDKYSNPLLKKLYQDSTQSMIDDLTEQIRVYESNRI